MAALTRHRVWTAADETRVPVRTALDTTVEPDWLRRRRFRDSAPPRLFRQAHRAEAEPVVDEPRPMPGLVLTPLDLVLAALPFAVGLLLLFAGADHGRVVL